jgi:hypothetical protein
MVRRRRGAAWLCFALVACTPTFADETAIVSSPRLLAVQGVPAEGAPGAGFTLTALYVDGRGVRDPSAIDWATCSLPKPLGEPGPISEACFVDASPDLVSLGDGGTVHGTIPTDACQLFGPDSPPPQKGQPSARPTDPDTTGGFYLPVRAKSGEGPWSAALERIACQPSGVTRSVSLAFTSGYRINTNPAVSALARIDADGAATLIAPDAADAADAADAPVATPALAVAAGERVGLRVEWPPCAGSDACGGAESYLYIDPTSKEVVTRRESMVASWYASAGAFDEDRSGRAETDPTASADDAWTAPAMPGPVHLWVVLRDARGGVGWAAYTLTVEP